LQEIEVPLLSVLSRIERTGVRLDRRMLEQQSNELAKQMHDLEQKAYAIAGHNFNMGSPKQIGQIFFEELGLPVIAKTPKGAPSTAESVLQELAEQGHELPQVILDHRGLAKLKSTYTDKLPELVNPDTGRLHTSYHQAVAATGRLSSSRYAAMRAVASARPSFRRTAGACWRRITRRSSCVSWRICPVTRDCSTHSPPVRTSIARPPPRSSVPTARRR
jgi:hypothetical protein